MIITMKKLKFYRTRTSLPKGTKLIDTINSASRELFFITHPNISKADPQAPLQLKKFLSRNSIDSLWAYYPWLSTAVRVPQEDIYYQLRTARNRNLITEDEQHLYRNTVVGVAGLSVGSAVISSLVATGGSKNIKIADPDIIEITNLNRMQASLLDIGKNKAEITARRIWGIDPYANIEIWNKGLHKDGLKKFFFQKPKLDIFVDEMDDIAMKFAVRFSSRDARIPVVMATDNGDSVIVDVERFDLEPKRPIFHGRVRLSESQLQNMSRTKFVELSTKIIDPTYFTTRQQQSILAIGKEVSGIAQLGSAASIAGAAIAYVVRQIANKQKIPSGRYVIGCEQTFIEGYNSATKKKARERATLAFLKALKERR